MPPGSNDWGILFLSCLSLCLLVCLIVCLSVVNFNLCYSFLTVRDRDFIFGIHTPLMTPFQMTPRSTTLRPWLWPWSENSFWDFVAAGFTNTTWFFRFIYFFWGGGGKKEYGVSICVFPHSTEMPTWRTCSVQIFKNRIVYSFKDLRKYITFQYMHSCVRQRFWIPHVHTGGEAVLCEIHGTMGQRQHIPSMYTYVSIWCYMYQKLHFVSVLLFSVVLRVEFLVIKGPEFHRRMFLYLFCKWEFHTEKGQKYSNQSWFEWESVE